MRKITGSSLSLLVATATTVVVLSCNSDQFTGSSAKKRPTAFSGGDQNRCLPEPLPNIAITPKKLFTYLPPAPSAQFTQFASTAMTGRLDPADTSPSIIAIGFEKVAGVCNGAVASPGRIFAVDGKDGRHKWTGRNGSGEAIPLDASVAPALGDVNGDGKMEVFAIEHTTEKVVALNHDGVKIWNSTESTGSRTAASRISPEWIHGISLADLDRDGSTELIAPGMVLDARTGALKFSLAKGQHAYPADTNLQGTMEIVLGTGIVNSSGTTICRFEKNLANLGIARLHKDDPFLTVIGPTWEAPPNPADSTKLVAYRGDNCQEIFSVPLGDSGGGPPNIADLDGKDDQGLEIGIAGKTRYAVFDNTGKVLWSRPTQDASSARTGSTAFDFNGDGRTEVVYNDEYFLRVFDGQTGNVIYEAPNTSYTAHEYPVVADVDGNGTANIVAVSNSCIGGDISGVHVFSEPEDRWVNTRPIWSQYGFNPLSMKDDGSVTGTDADAILRGALPSPHLAGFRNNIAFPRDQAACK
ncbi:MAG: hypothetical protein RIQ81_1004 [Pseudomonadota bacterium]